MIYSYVFPLTNKLTRVSAMSATIIDNIFTNIYLSSSKSGVLSKYILDHMPIFYTGEYEGITKVNKTVYKWI